MRGGARGVGGPFFSCGTWTLTKVGTALRVLPPTPAPLSRAYAPGAWKMTHDGSARKRHRANDRARAVESGDTSASDAGGGGDGASIMTAGDSGGGALAADVDVDGMPHSGQRGGGPGAGPDIGCLDSHGATRCGPWVRPGDGDSRTGALRAATAVKPPSHNMRWTPHEEQLLRDGIVRFGAWCLGSRRRSLLRRRFRLTCLPRSSMVYPCAGVAWSFLFLFLFLFVCGGRYL